MSVVFQLSGSELHLATMVGVQRALDAIRNGRKQRYGRDPGPAFDENIFAAAGEMALAKHFIMFWNGAFGNFEAADVGWQYQVRATEYLNGHLLLHPDDKDDQPFVLAIAQLPVITLAGWVWGRDGKLDNYWAEPRPHRPCYCVPQSALTDVDQLQ